MIKTSGIRESYPLAFGQRISISHPDEEYKAEVYLQRMYSRKMPRRTALIEVIHPNDVAIDIERYDQEPAPKGFVLGLGHEGQGVFILKEERGSIYLCIDVKGHIEKGISLKLMGAEFLFIRENFLRNRGLGNKVEMLKNCDSVSGEAFRELQVLVETMRK